MAKIIGPTGGTGWKSVKSAVRGAARKITPIRAIATPRQNVAKASAVSKRTRTADVNWAMRQFPGIDKSEALRITRELRNSGFEPRTNPNATHDQHKQANQDFWQSARGSRVRERIVKRSGRPGSGQAPPSGRGNPQGHEAAVNDAARKMQAVFGDSDKYNADAVKRNLAGKSDAWLTWIKNANASDLRAYAQTEGYSKNGLLWYH